MSDNGELRALDMFLTDEEIAAITAGLHLLRLEIGQPTPWREYLDRVYTGGGQFEGLSPERITELAESVSEYGANIPKLWPFLV